FGVLLTGSGQLLHARRRLLKRGRLFLGGGGDLLRPRRELLGGEGRALGRLPRLTDDDAQLVDEGVEPAGQLAELVLASDLEPSGPRAFPRGDISEQPPGLAQGAR